MNIQITEEKTLDSLHRQSQKIVFWKQREGKKMNQNPNQNQNQQPSDGVKHDDDAALTDFLASLMDYTPTVKS